MVSVGDVIDERFRVAPELGAGGMAIVVVALHLELGHRVAIKRLPADPLDVDAALRQTIWRGLEKAPAARFAHVASSPPRTPAPTTSA